MNLMKFDYVNENDKSIAESFVKSSGIKKYVLGRNKYSADILKNMEVDGIIDDFTDEHFFNGKEVYKMEEVEKDSLVVSATMGAPLTAKRKLDKLGIKNIDYFAFYKYSGQDLCAPPFIMDFEEDFTANYENYEYVYNLLADDISREVFERIINFKITFDIKFMDSFTNRHNEQYFEKSIIPANEKHVFVDGGGYVGDTTLEFIKEFPVYKKIYFFEPDKNNMNTAHDNLKNFNNIELFNIGLSNKLDTLHFVEDGLSSAINIDGDSVIKVNSLDNIIKDEVTFIKLDIEGAEQDAIEGAEGIIRKYHPVLAVCIYHKAQDWHQIPLKILSISREYKVYIRHYLEGISETVMYFVPYGNK